MTDEERQMFSRRLRERDAEIERLNAVINGMVEKGMDDLTMVAAFQLNEEQRAEIERLRAVLRYISELDDDHEAPVLARRALEPKP